MDFKKSSAIFLGIVLISLIWQTSVKGENLVQNGDFESGNGLPAGWFVTGQKQALSYEKTGGRIGEKCMKIENASGSVTIRQFNIVLSTEQQYKLSGYLKTENFSGTGGITVSNEGWSWDCGFTKPSEATTDWVYLEKNFTPKPSSNGKYQVVFFTLQSSGKIWLDGINLEPVGTASTPIDEEKVKQEKENIKAIIAQSLVLNPSFELVDPQDPNKPVSWGPIIRAEPGEISKPVLTYEKKGFLDDRCVSIYTPTNTDWGEWESEPIKLKPNTLYEITFWGKTNGEGQVGIIFDGVIRRIGGFPRDWGRISELFITEPAAIQSTIRLLLYHRANQTVWFDHISLYPAEIELEEPKDNSTITKNSPLFRWSAPISAKFLTLQYSTNPQFTPEKTTTIANLDKTSYIPTETLGNGTWYWRVKVKTDEKRPESVSNSNIFMVQAEEGGDTTPPQILAMAPKSVSGPKPEIKITYKDDKKGSGIDPKKVKIILDKNDLTAKSKITETQLTIIPDNLPTGKHEVKISITDKAGNPSFSTWSFSSYAEEPTVSLREDNVLIVEGKPFFPLGFYSPLDTEDFKVFKENGFNCFTRYGLLQQPLERIKRWLDECEKAGLKMIPGGLETQEDSKETIVEKLDFLKNHNATIGWYIPDEPDNRGLDVKKMVQGREWTKEITYKPCMTTFCLPSRFSDYADTVDIFWVDPYPYFKTDGGPKKTLTMVSDWVEKGRKAVKDNKPVWVVPQIFSGRPPDERVPTYWELRCMSYLGIVAGAKGVIYYAFQPSHDHVKEHPGLWLGVKALGKELSSLNPVLLSPDDSQEFIVESSLDIHYLLKEYKNELYLFAVNGSEQEGKVIFTLPAWNKENSISVFPEARTISLSSGKFSDNFKPYEVHIYTNDKNLPRVKTIDEINKESLDAENNWWEIQKNNVALGYNGAEVIPSAEASYSGFNSCFINDGVKKTHWAPKTGAPAWLKIEFEKEAEINKVVVESPYYPFFDQPRDIGLESYKLSYWNGANWTELASVENNNKVENIHQFSPIRTKKIKIDLLKGTGIAEIECWKYNRP